MRITVIETPTSKKGKFAVVYKMSAWPHGTLKNRGWLHAAVRYERDATPDEEMEQAAAWRFVAYRYNTWAEVVSDEEKFGIDADAEVEKWRRREAA